MTNRSAGVLLAGSTLLLLAATMFAEAQAQKQARLLPAPTGYDAKRDNIDRGTLETVPYDSKTTGSKRNFVAYLPPGYAKTKKYPVFYLLHGLNGDENNWTKKNAAPNILDNLYADKKIEPMIVVMPNCMVTEGGKPAAGGKSADYITGFEKDLLNDIIPAAEGRFPIMADADHRALGGFSMGGGQALVVGLKNQDKFHWIGAFSPGLYPKEGAQIAKVEESNKKLKLLYLACGDSPKETLFPANKELQASWEKSKVNHVWNVFTDGEHSNMVWKSDLYAFSQLIFKEKK